MIFDSIIRSLSQIYNFSENEVGWLRRFSRRRRRELPKGRRPEAPLHHQAFAELHGSALYCLRILLVEMERNQTASRNSHADQRDSRLRCQRGLIKFVTKIISHRSVFEIIYSLFQRSTELLLITPFRTMVVVCSEVSAEFSDKNASPGDKVSVESKLFELYYF